VEGQDVVKTNTGPTPNITSGFRKARSKNRWSRDAAWYSSTVR